MNHRNRDEGDRNRYPRSAYGQGRDADEGQSRDRYQQGRRYGARQDEQLQGRGDRDIQSDYSGGGYDQVGVRSQSRDYDRGAEWRRQQGRGREGGYAQSRGYFPDDSSQHGEYASDPYGSEFGYGSRDASGYSGAGYGYGASGAGGVGYGAPGYGAGGSYGSGSQYRGEFQSDLEDLGSRMYGEDEGAGSRNYIGGMETGYGRGQGGAQRHGPMQGGQSQTRGGAGQGYGERAYQASQREYRAQSHGSGGLSGQQGSPQSTLQGSQQARSYRGIGPRNYTRSDERIREDLNERLTDAHDIDASNITVEVSNGVATLSGTVDERWMKHRAEDIADGCSGVRDVRNMIQTTPRTSGQAMGSEYGSSHVSGARHGGASSPGVGNSSTSGATTSGSSDGGAAQKGASGSQNTPPTGAQGGSTATSGTPQGSGSSASSTQSPGRGGSGGSQPNV